MPNPYRAKQTRVLTLDVEPETVDAPPEVLEEPPTTVDPPRAAVPQAEVPFGTARDVLDWVGQDRDRAEAALVVERAGRQRTSLIADLEKRARRD